MRSTYLKVLFIYTMALICAMFIKVLIIDLSPVDQKEPVIVLSSAIDYKEVTVENEEGSFARPSFKEESIDAIVDEYIEENSCSYLDYNIHDLKSGRVNIFLNCGTPKNVIYDYKNKKNLTMENLTKKYPEFLKASKRLLNLKYPKFHVDDIDFTTAVYDIKENEIVGYYNSTEYGPVTYHINNNEIKDYMDYPMSYDDAYTNEVYTLDPNKKTIAFSYDDGPSTYDLELIDLLVNSHSTATFFVVGNRINNYPTAVNKLATSGMEIGNHTYDHKSLTSLSTEKVIEEITKTNDLFYAKTGKQITMLRPSYGAVNKRVLLAVNMPSILWSIDTLDWKTRNADKVYEAIMKDAKDGEIVLMHSLYKTTVEATDRAIKSLYKEGYQIVSVGELAKLKGKTLSAGSSYTRIR